MEPKKKGAQRHKENCQCRFCKLRRLKETQPVQAPTQPIAEAPVVEKAPPDAPNLTKEAQGKEAPPLVPPVVPKESFKKRLSGKQLALTILGAALVVVGFGIGAIWYATFRQAEESSIWGALPALVLIIGGVWLVLVQNLTSMFQTPAIIMKDGRRIEAPKAQVNSLNIYPDRIVFENTPEPKGQPWRWRQDGRSYYIHKADANGVLQAFDLPDQAFYEPRLFAERVLTLPAHQRIFRRKEKLLEQLRPLIAGGMIVVVGILMVMTTG